MNAYYSSTPDVIDDLKYYAAFFFFEGFGELPL